MNSVILGALIAVGLILYFSLIELRKILLNQNSAFDQQRSALDEKFQDLEEYLSRLDEKIDSVEENTLSPLQKEWRAFERARDLTLGMIRSFKAGEMLQLVAKSYNNPNDEPHVARFTHKHDHLDENKPSKYGYEVHGYWRISGSNQWEPYQFLASKKESLTSTCEGTIRQV